MYNLLNIFIFLSLMLSACIGAPKPQELPPGHYIGSVESSIYKNEPIESIVMNYKLEASATTQNGNVVIYDSNQEATIMTINVIDHGTWHTITNGQNGLTNPCFTGRIGSSTNKQVSRGWPIAFVNCWLAEGFIPGSYTFQAQYLIWNPISTIYYASFSGTVFLHAPTS